MDSIWGWVISSKSCRLHHQNQRASCLEVLHGAREAHASESRRSPRNSHRCGQLPWRLLWAQLLMPLCAAAQGTDQAPEEFIRNAFGGTAPEPSKMWINDDLKRDIHTILDHDLNILRLRYWAKDGRTVWILDEIGKEQPITAGIVVNRGKIETIKVLIFRESRGWEVRYPFFIDQFTGANLVEDLTLDRTIDGISGATLSVRALTKLARLALLLHARSEFADGSWKQ